MATVPVRVVSGEIDASPSPQDYDEAEKLLKPYLNSAAVFGIAPDHRFRDIDMLPWKLYGDIAVALMRARVR